MGTPDQDVGGESSGDGNAEEGRAAAISPWWRPLVSLFILGLLGVALAAGLHYHYSPHGHRQYWAFLGVLAACGSAIAVSLTILLILRQVNLQRGALDQISREIAVQRGTLDLLNEQWAYSRPGITLVAEAPGSTRVWVDVYYASSLGPAFNVVISRKRQEGDPAPALGEKAPRMVPVDNHRGSSTTPGWLWCERRIQVQDAVSVCLPVEGEGNTTLQVFWTAGAAQDFIQEWTLYCGRGTSMIYPNGPPDRLAADGRGVVTRIQCS
jgi:hypothetical protein